MFNVNEYEKEQIKKLEEDIFLSVWGKDYFKNKDTKTATCKYFNTKIILKKLYNLFFLK